MNNLVNNNPATHSLTGKVVLIITGYDQGGQSLALSLAERGADLALLYKPENETGALKMKQQIVQQEAVHCQIFPLTLSEPDDAQETIRRVVEKMGSIDILLDCSQMGKGD